jgi:3-isopropylmalate dehydratase small subunit
MPNLGLLGITMVEEYFYESAKDGEDISIDFNARSIYVDGQKFYFQLSQMEKELFEYGGIASAFQKFGNTLFDVMTAPKGLEGSARKTQEKAATPHLGLQW